jgi:hypothetical protein
LLSKDASKLKNKRQISIDKILESQISLETEDEEVPYIL